MNTQRTIITHALSNALWTVLYIILISLFLSNTPTIFGNSDEKTALIPIVMLMLFVFSATVCSALILGRPILWYIDNKKAEAVRLFAYTLLIFFVVMIIMASILFFLR